MSTAKPHPSTDQLKQGATNTSRRQFLKSGAVATVGTAVVANLAVPSRVHAAGSDLLKIGLVGCGGRGKGAASDASKADANTQLHAIADVFPDHVEAAKRHLQESLGNQYAVADDRCYAGFDAFKHVIDQVDVVLLATPPHFRPEHLRYAVERGVHAFVEKPIATDATGVRSVLDTCKQAEQKGLSIVSGLCWRYFLPRRKAVQRVQEGAIGDITAIQTTYNSGGVWDPRKKRDEVDSDMEYQLRNWYYYTWLSGDHIAEQAVHGLDTMGWVMGDDPPEKCWGIGGRQVRTDPIYGNIYDHFSLVYEYANGVRGYHTCRHWRGTEHYVRDFVLGSNGICDVFGPKIKGNKKWSYQWKYEGPKPNMYEVEHQELFAAIRAGKPINNGRYMAHSTMLAIMGRMCAYTGKSLTWDQCLNSQERLGPDAYHWGPAPEVNVAVPGITPFI